MKDKWGGDHLAYHHQWCECLGALLSSTSCQPPQLLPGLGLLSSQPAMGLTFEIELGLVLVFTFTQLPKIRYLSWWVGQEERSRFPPPCLFATVTTAIRGQ